MHGRFTSLTRAGVGDDVARAHGILDPVQISVLVGSDTRAVPVGLTIGSREQEARYVLAARDVATGSAAVAGLGGDRVGRRRRFRLGRRLGLGDGLAHRLGLRLRGRFRLGGRDRVVAVEAAAAPHEEHGEEREGSEDQHTDAESPAQTVAGRAALGDGLLHLGR